MTTRWPGIEWYQVLLVLAVPAEFPEKSKSILRKCAYDANLISNLRTYKLQFTTERKQYEKFLNTIYNFLIIIFLYFTYF